MKIMVETTYDPPSFGNLLRIRIDDFSRLGESICINFHLNGIEKGLDDEFWRDKDIFFRAWNELGAKIRYEFLERRYGNIAKIIRAKEARE